MSRSPATVPTVACRERVRSRPEEPVVLYQRWRDLLFLHWEWDPEELQAGLPDGLYVDRFAGRAYVGIVPFEMRRVRPRFLPAVPGISNFLELNLRTYVHDRHGRPGVWFYSLDADQWLAVVLARSLFSLPYFRAGMQVERHAEDEIRFVSTRRSAQATPLTYRYTPRGEMRHAPPESLDYFLLERYVLFADTRSGLRYGRVHHAPYPIRSVELAGYDARLFELDGFTTPDRPPDHAVASPGVVVSIHAMRPVGKDV